MRWERKWHVPGLVESLSIRFSARLRATLGRSEPKTGRVLLHTLLREAPKSMLREVLCHEAAHVAAYRLYGKRIQPHGAEWKALVRLAGYSPTVRHSLGSASRARRSRERFTTVHTCPVCQTRRFARRPVPRWRCAECVAAGLDGHLEITRTVASS